MNAVSAESAHTMRAAAGPPDWPRLQPGEIESILTAWGLPAAGMQVRWHSPRPLSAAAIIDLPDGPLFVKRHHRSVRMAAELEEEHRFIAHLHGRGALVSRVLPTAAGGTAQTHGDWTYELQTLGSGIDLYRDAVSWSPFETAHHAVAAGQALARLHRAARDYHAPPRAAHMLVSNDRIIRSTHPLAVVRGLLGQRPGLKSYLDGRNWEDDLARALEPFHSRFLEAWADHTPLWTHNDWHASNLLWSNAGGEATVSTVLDFGLCDRTSAIYDLATAIERNTIPWLDIHDGSPGSADLSLVTALLTGYLGETRLGARERAALPAVLPLVHVGYAITEIEYFRGITHSDANADLAYDAFLLGHCRWFTSAAGRDLLAHIRSELERLP